MYPFELRFCILTQFLGKIEEETFKEIFDIMASEEIQPSDEYLCSKYLLQGHIIFGRNPLICDCSIKWIVENPKYLNVIDWPGIMSHKRPVCKDGTLVADLDLNVLNALCP